MSYNLCLRKGTLELGQYHTRKYTYCILRDVTYWTKIVSSSFIHWLTNPCFRLSPTGLWSSMNAEKMILQWVQKKILFLLFFFPIGPFQYSHFSQALCSRGPIQAFVFWAHLLNQVLLISFILFAISIIHIMCYSDWTIASINIMYLFLQCSAFHLSFITAKDQSSQRNKMLSKLQHLFFHCLLWLLIVLSEEEQKTQHWTTIFYKNVIHFKF